VHSCRSRSSVSLEVCDEIYNACRQLAFFSFFHNIEKIKYPRKAATAQREELQKGPVRIEKYISYTRAQHIYIDIVH
jgi:hypothetical protein